MNEECLSEKRKRLGELILKDGFDSLDNKELLEYYLCLSTGGCDSKKISENLFGCYKTLEEIIKKARVAIKDIDDEAIIL